MQNDPNIPLSVKCSIDPQASWDGFLKEKMSQQQTDKPFMNSPMMAFDSFQTYFKKGAGPKGSSVHDKSDSKHVSEESENLDSKLEGLRNSYRNILDTLKSDQLDNEKQFEPTESHPNVLELKSDGKVAFHSPRGLDEEKPKSVTKNLSNELKFQATSSKEVVQGDNIENSYQLMKIFNSQEDDKSRKSTPVYKVEPIKIEGDNSKVVSPKPTSTKSNSSQVSQRYKYAFLNL